MNLYSRLICCVSLEMPKIINTCYHLNSETESSNCKGLILIPPCLARATGWATSPVECENLCGIPGCDRREKTWLGSWFFVGAECS